MHGYTPFAEAHSPYHLCLDFASARCKLVGQLVFTAAFAGYHPTILEKRRFASTNASAVRLELANTDDTKMWVVNEIRFYHQGAEVVRNPVWKLRASEMPNLARMAFDGSPSTAWSPWDFAHAGSYIEVQFGREMKFDEIRMWLAPIAHFADVKILVNSSNPEWSEKKYTLETAMAKWPNIPRDAALAIRREGFGYLLGAGDHAMTAELLRNMNTMGLEIIASHQEGLVFRILDEVDDGRDHAASRNHSNAPRWVRESKDRLDDTR